MQPQHDLASSAPDPALSEPWQLRFWSIWLGQALSLTGSALTQFVLLWWITLNTGSTTALSIAGVMALLPQALLGPLGGILADRYSRRMLMIVADVISAACMLGLVWLFQSDQIQLWHLYVMMFIRSSMQAFQAPAAAASTAMLVPTAWLSRVAGLNQMLQGVMTIAAAPLGALLLAFLPFEGALLIDVVTALFGIVPLLVYRIPQAPRNVAQRGGLWTDFLGGAHVIVHNRGLLMLYGLVALVVLTIMPTFTLTPLLVKDHFGGGVNEVALMEGLAGIGIIVGGALIAAVPLFKRRIVTILLSFAISCVTVAFTALMPSSLFWLAVFWWTLSGVTFSTGNAPLIALIQSQVPNQLQGRVLSLLSTVMGLAAPLGLGLAALLGAFIGVRGIFIVGGLASATICLLGFALPDLLRIEDQPLRAERTHTANVNLTDRR
ncbi:MFS transporter [Candidatus Chloroploca sp. M-50]|uniref:MFS transporter n=1 Tax=Candidatus Chloroploca mongolica TaxID=2528176 RepID=A0ABS4DFM1_9CHLR|nr:MFS transporter [Candidatus Chloroploca mongolica]MBP1468223.1 MFS transporter [Candidatus Chloroploca mongolica]